MNRLSDFKKMHEQNEPLFLPNAWDVLSALVLAQVGFKAIGTTSWGIANSMGANDGEQIQFDEHLALIEKIISAVEIPVTVDIESGYSDSISVVVDNVLKIADLGASGINIEDSLKNRPQKNRSGLNDKNRQCELLAQIRGALDSHGCRDFFINARIDTYLQQKEPLQETIARAIRYIDSGADGVFVPGLCDKSEITELVKSIAAPLNVMSLPGCTDIESLGELGVKRFSIGSALSDATISFIEESARTIFAEHNTEILHANSAVKRVFK